MEKIKKLLLRIAVLAAAGFVLSGLSGTLQVEAAGKITLDKKNVYINISKGYKLPNVSAKNVSRNVTWTVKNKAVAQLYTGKNKKGVNKYGKKYTGYGKFGVYIVGKKAGTTKVTAKAKGYKSVSFTIHVADSDIAAVEYMKTGKNRYGLSKDELKAAKAIKKSISEIISKDMSRLDKVKAVNDYIAKINTYDRARYEKKKYKDFDHTIAGPMIYHTSVCEGYARVFDVYMKYMGIPSKYISGKSADTGNGHAWNLVKMEDGKWYHVDVTWNDKDSEFVVGYKYFLLTDKEIEASRTWTRKSYPKCNGTKYNGYSDLLNLKAIADMNPGSVTFTSRNEAVQYIISEIASTRPAEMKVIYLGEEWFTEEDKAYIRQQTGCSVSFYGVTVLESRYRMYDVKVQYY